MLQLNSEVDRAAKVTRMAADAAVMLQNQDLND
jgi:hypothetical protein